jgi:ATP-dependent RNA helicase DeaD
MTNPTTDAESTPPEPSSAAGFSALGLSDAMSSSLAELGYEEPTPIQRAAIPPLLEGRDLLGQAATGTGKTAAFALPLLQRLDADAKTRAKPSILVLVPTRELAVQVAEAVHKYGKSVGASVLPVYGGTAMFQQLRALSRGVDVVIATPGRALDHIRRKTLELGALRAVVLDEADEMLDMGFAEDLEAILEATPKERQTALFSATMPQRIAAIAARHLKDPVKIAIAREKVAAGEMPKVRQSVYIVPRAHKLATLGRVLDMENPTSALVFCRTRNEVDELTESLNGRGYRAEAMHGGMTQEQRERVMKRFRTNKSDLLIATDVAARGLDIEHLSHVVNFDVPTDPDAYVHRIGRTGRAGREGTAITLAEPREHRLVRNIEHATRQKIEVATVPTVADLRARRIDLSVAALREELVKGELDSFRVAVETLAAEYDVMDIAAAGVKLAHDAAGEGNADDVEIPTVIVPHERRDRGNFGGRERPRFGDRSGPRFGDRSGPRFGDRDGPRFGDRPGPRFGDRDKPRFGDKHGRSKIGGPPERSDISAGGEVERAGGEAPDSDRGDSARPQKPWFKAKDRGPRRMDGDTTRIFIGAGRMAGVRPGDLVGAIANEAGIESRAIGAIQIADRFSLVEVRAEVAGDVIRALRGTTIMGRKVTVRKDFMQE